MASAKFEPGPTARTVAANVRRLREDQNLSTHKLATRLRRTGSSMTPTSVQRLEDGQRRVDVDDLMHLCRVFNVIPSTLLLPDFSDPDELVEITAHKANNPLSIWLWALGDLDGVGAWDGDNFNNLSEGYQVRSDTGFRAETLPEPVAERINARETAIETQEQLIDSMSDLIEKRIEMDEQARVNANALERLEHRLSALEKSRRNGE